MKKNQTIESAIRIAFDILSDVSDEDFIKHCKSQIRKYCKPCWELKYCPYGPLVEQFPLPPVSLKEATEQNEYFKECVQTNKTADGKRLTKERKELFELLIKEFDPKKYLTNELPKYLQEMSCKIFGHFCPVFFSGEAFTETKTLRNNSRNIPRDVLIKVIKRDGQICQKCFKYVPESEIELDHIIPISKGGPTTVENLRVLCFECNRKKLNSITEIVDDNPLQKHINTIIKKD